jgi:hypothetical protein
MIHVGTRVAYQRSYLAIKGLLETPMATARGVVVSAVDAVAMVQWDKRLGPNKPQQVTITQLEEA